MKMNAVIKKLRNAKGLTQEQLSDLVGISLQTVRRWEWGESAPNTKVLPRLAEVLDTTPDKLLYDDTPDPVAAQPITKPTIKATDSALIYERNGERLELPPTAESYAIFREIAHRIAARESPVVTA